MSSPSLQSDTWASKEEATSLHLHRLSEAQDALRTGSPAEEPNALHVESGDVPVAPTLNTLNRAFDALSNQYQEQSRAPRRTNQLLPIKVNETPTKPMGHSLDFDSHVETPTLPARSATPPPRPVNINGNSNNNTPMSRRLTDVTGIPCPPKRKASPSLAAAGVNNNSGNSGVAKSRDGRIQVVVRKRPLMPHEGGTDCVVADETGVTLAMTKQRIDLTEYTEKTTFSFDTVFSESMHNEDIYQSCMEPLLEVAMAGGSASIFAYGQTGSGKTHTMMGSENEKGLYYLSVAEILRRATDGQQFYVAFYEIYCNSLFDLLNGRYPVMLREDANRRMNLCGLLWKLVTCIDDLWSIISTGMEIRSTGSTSANERSSRSHAVMTIRIHASETSKALPGMLNFVDLAGSERAVDTDANDKLTRMEGAEINKSLLALKECIRSLDEKKKHVPFRGSKLTEVLRDSFTGNSKTVMIANISPSSINVEHTANTLRYAFRVKGLSIAPIVPSKERNAPRPFVLGVRPRLSTASPHGGAESPSKRRRSARRSPSPQLQSPTRKGKRPLKQQLQEDGATPTKASSEENISQFSKLLHESGKQFLANADDKDVLDADDADDTKVTCLCTKENIKQMEREITRRIMLQLEKDLGHDLRQVLDERDARITRLEEENQYLRQHIASMKETTMTPATRETATPRKDDLFQGDYDYGF